MIHGMQTMTTITMTSAITTTTKKKQQRKGDASLFARTCLRSIRIALTYIQYDTISLAQYICPPLPPVTSDRQTHALIYHVMIT